MCLCVCVWRGFFPTAYCATLLRSLTDGHETSYYVSHTAKINPGRCTRVSSNASYSILSFIIRQHVHTATQSSMVLRGSQKISDSHVGSAIFRCTTYLHSC